MDMKPKLLLPIEGAAVLFAACILYHRSHASWLWFALLFFTPDVFMLGYLINKRLGATVYNFGHTYIAPFVLFSALWIARARSFTWLPLIWLAHIGFDRLIGYGLKYETAFNDTHLQRV